MITVVSIVRVEKKPFAETVSSGGTSSVPLIQRKVIAPVLGFYSVGVSTGDVTEEYEAEVRDGPNGVQIDWGDELQDLLTQYGCSDTEFLKLTSIIYSVHSGSEYILPMDLNTSGV